MLELANDFLLMLQIYMSMCFTKFVPNPEDQFEAGKVNIIILTIQILVNFAFVLKNLLSVLKLIYIKFQNSQKKREDL